MSQPIRSRSLRRNLFLAMAAVIFLALLFDRLYEYAVVRPRDVEREYALELRERSYGLSRDYARLLLGGDIQALRMSVAARATNTLVTRMAVTDENGKVIASTLLADEDLSLAAATSYFDPDAFREAQRDNQLVVRLSPDRGSLLGYAPVPLPPRAGELRSLRTGILFMHVDITPIKAASWQNLFSIDSLSRWFLTLSLATLFLAFVVSRQIFRPLRHLEEVARQLGRGDWQARSRLAGNGELVALGEVFNEMGDRIVTDRQNLMASESRFRTLVETSPLPMLVTSLPPESRVLLMNRRFTELFGYTPADIKDVSTWWPLAYPDPVYRAEVEATWGAAVEAMLAAGDKHIQPVCANVSCKDGGTRFIEVHMAVEGDCSLVVFNDLTERRDYELELQRHRQNLEALVAERTAELTVAKDVAEAANRAKSTFLANMSHELRTPMNAIMGMTELALRNATEPRLRDRLGKVIQASQHLLHVINDILDISKIEAERLTLEKTSFKLGEVLENLLSLIGHRATDKGLKLQVDLPPEAARLSLLGDPVRLGQILLNLAGNAVKFTDRGLVAVRVGLLEDNSAGVLLRFEVQDSGIGISAENQRRIFTAFEQADGSMTRKYGGTGLGLCISKRLVHMMGGEIGVESREGAGSTFWFTVRLGKAAGDAVSPLPVAENVAAEARLKLGHAGARILLAEDEPINQEVSRGLLEDAGLAVDLAEDGQQALEMAKASQYDLILMDMQMPNLNGVDATRAIRALPGYALTPILAMTANAFDKDRQTCIDAGMNDHIAKPVDPGLLFETLLKWLEKPHG